MELAPVFIFLDSEKWELFASSVNHKTFHTKISFYKNRVKKLLECLSTHIYFKTSLINEPHMFKVFSTQNL